MSRSLSSSSTATASRRSSSALSRSINYTFRLRCSLRHNRMFHTAQPPPVLPLLSIPRVLLCNCPLYCTNCRYSERVRPLQPVQRYCPVQPLYLVHKYVLDLDTGGEVQKRKGATIQSPSPVVKKRVRGSDPSRPSTGYRRSQPVATAPLRTCFAGVEGSRFVAARSPRQLRRSSLLTISAGKLLE